MKMNKELKCKIRKTDSGFEYDCGKEKHGICPVSQKGKGGGLSILGNGLNGDYSDTDLKCFDSQDLKKKLSKKYNQNVELDLE
ncbi:hypothetical protein J4481_01485 [Candidatus Pacearchaeota archaeon]|nr:hypothetical protein [Candidatus Pacearchaeota archaeon]